MAICLSFARKRNPITAKRFGTAAGSLIVEEAGGRVSHLMGQPLDFTQGRSLENNVGIVATNGHLHETALAAIRSVFQDLAV